MIIVWVNKYADHSISTFYLQSIAELSPHPEKAQSKKNLALVL